jgi:ribA/ribD-fused uncharacterized protein
MAEPGRVKFLFFWGHRPQHGGGIGPGCLSQWWPSAFSIDGVQYATAEHYMMAAKARLFGDDRALEQILVAPSPGAAKPSAATSAASTKASGRHTGSKS